MINTKNPQSSFGTQGRKHESIYLTASTIFGSTLLVFICATVVVASILFLIGFSLGVESLVGGFILAVLYCVWSVRQKLPSRWGMVTIVLAGLMLLTILISVVISQHFRETTSDGQTYHGLALIEFRDGYNPYHSSVGQAYVATERYPAASWIFGTTLFQLTGRIDSSRAYQFLLLIAATAIVFPVYVQLIPDQRAKMMTVSLLTAITVLNPVVTNQLLSFFVDGPLMLVLTILIFQTLALRQSADPPILLAFSAAVVLAINLKLSGIAYVGVIIGGMWLWFLVADEIIPALAGLQGEFAHRVTALFRAISKPFKTWTMVFLLAGIFAVFFVGYSSYIRNTLNYGSPFGGFRLDRSNVYSVSTSENTGDNAEESSEYLERFKRQFSNWFLSVFSASQTSASPPPRLKWPFTMTVAEIHEFRTPGHRIGGFGPLFSGVVVTAAGVLLANIIAGLRKPARSDRHVFVLMGIVLFSAAITSAPYYARYTPQQWLIPVLVALLAFIANRSRVLKVLSYLLIAVMLANISIVGGSYFVHQMAETRIMNEELQALAQYQSGGGPPIDVYIKNRHIVQVYLDEYGINYTVIYDRGLLTCAEPTKISFTDGEVLYCVPPD